MSAGSADAAALLVRTTVDSGIVGTGVIGSGVGCALVDICRVCDDGPSLRAGQRRVVCVVLRSVGRVAAHSLGWRVHRSPIFTIVVIGVVVMQETVV